MDDEKLSGRVIIDTILANMREQVEELRYSKIVPAAYDVYLHADDQYRFESLGHEIAAEAVRALQERLDALNRPSRLDRARELAGKPRLPHKKVGPWLVRITRDPEGAVPRGRALVVSQIALAGADSFEGQRTRRLATLSEAATASPDAHPNASGPERTPEPGTRDRPAVSPESGTGAESRPASGPRAPEARHPEPHAVAAPLSPVALAENGAAEHADTVELPPGQVLAVLTWEDEAGPHRYPIIALELTVGRAGLGSTADVRIATRPDVSRVHVRIRFDPEHQGFAIEDLSMLGTAVNGELLGRGAPRAVSLPAEIRLADVITLRLEREALP